MKYLKTYIIDRLANGHYFFTKEEALKELSLTDIQFNQQVWRLSHIQKIYKISQGFYMIIPDEYKNLESLPAHWIIGPYMNYLKQDYYISLLSAAWIYGTTHQQPMTLQVITNKPKRLIKLPRGSIEFHVNKFIHLSKKEEISTPTGYAFISTKEQTLLDLVRFQKQAGYLNNVATIIKDLAPQISIKLFSDVISISQDKSALQRLGYILEFLNYTHLSDVIYKELLHRSYQMILLKPDVLSREGDRIKKWKLIINDPIETEE